MKFILPVSDLNLEHTLECGQAFRWEDFGGCYAGVIGKAIVKVSLGGSGLAVETSSPVNRDDIARYFGLDEDLTSIYKQIGRDPHVKKAIDRFRGLRILNQDRWECLASFILSSYTNIPRIKKMIAGLSVRFGQRLVLGDLERYSFPGADSIARADLRTLRSLGLGFRAGYLKNTARMVSEKAIDLDAVGELNYEQAKKALICLRGVGDKVADCVLLFSFGKYEAFPVDVWIKRGIERLYFEGRDTSPKAVAEFARSRFGPYAGYAQEYLYHYLRHERG
ncbi:MAG: DNA glycosylase [Candidatus Omnitrophota bacterium]